MNRQPATNRVLRGKTDVQITPGSPKDLAKLDDWFRTFDREARVLAGGAEVTSDEKCVLLIQSWPAGNAVGDAVRDVANKPDYLEQEKLSSFPLATRCLLMRSTGTRFQRLPASVTVAELGRLLPGRLPMIICLFGVGSIRSSSSTRLGTLRRNRPRQSF